MNSRLPACRWRGNLLSTDHYSCTSPKLIVSQQGVSVAICAKCPYADHLPQAVDVRGRNGQLIELPACVHLGVAVRGSAAPDTIRDWRTCQRGHGVVCQCQQCNFCSERSTVNPSRIYRLQLGNLDQAETRAFNVSILAIDGGFLLAYRVGWGGGGIRLANLNHDLELRDDFPLPLNHTHCSYAAEDPRLFAFDGKVCISFCGVETISGFVGVHPMVAVLNDDFSVNRIWYPHYKHRTRIEKNWVYFEHEKALYCVYQSHPYHQILRIEDTASLVYSTPTNSIWQGGFIRGGASPVLYRGQWYHWFHGWKQQGSLIVYTVGVLTFEACPPFRVTRMTAIPVLSSDQTTNPKLPYHADKNVIFPCGANIMGNRWIISYGHHDAFCELAELDIDEVEDKLVSVK